MNDITIPQHIEQLDVSVLVPYAQNSRTHSNEQIDQISASIKEFGFTNPILIDENGGIIAGHGRVMAAKSMGLKQVPCLRLAHLSENQKRAYVIADNKLALNAGWDDTVLKLELQALMDDGFDLSLTGFTLDEFNDIEAEAEQTEGLTDEDAVPEAPINPVAKLGDVWQLGGHRLMCGDSTNAEQVAVLMDGGFANMWVTDPPYNVEYKGKTSESLTIKNDSMSDDNFREFLKNAYLAADANMKAGAVFYIWHADSEGYNFRGAAFDIGWQVRQCLIWKKQTMVMGRQDYHWKHEPCLYGWKEGAAHFWASDRTQTTILEFNRPSRNKEHPTMKPVDLIEYQIKNNSKNGHVILDSFGGGGSTLIACEKTNRLARLMELDEKYVDVIINRWQDFTGKTATLIATGQTFEQVKAERLNG